MYVFSEQQNVRTYLDFESKNSAFNEFLSVKTVINR